MKKYNGPLPFGWKNKHEFLDLDIDPSADPEVESILRKAEKIQAGKYDELVIDSLELEDIE